MENKGYTTPLELAKEIIAKLDEAQLTPEEAQALEGGAVISCLATTCNKPDLA